MDDTTQDVNTPESSTAQSIENEQVVNDVESNQTPADSQAPVETPAETPPPAPPLGDQSDVDELGVPWKNRAMEAQRKLDKVNEQYSTILNRLDQNQGQKEKEYTVEELEAFAEQTDNPAHRAWAQGKIRDLGEKRIANIIESKLTEKESAARVETLKSQSLNQVITEHPSAFTRDQSGNPTGWNMNDPMAQRIAQYMQDPDLKDNPRGLIVASALAYKDLNTMKNVKTQAQQTQLKSEVKDLQKKTLTEGGGVGSPPPAKTPLSAAKEKFAHSGSTRDGAVAFKEILKKRGRISEG